MDMAQMGDLLRSFFSLNSVGSIALRAAIWFIVAIVIIASTDTGGFRGSRSEGNLKSNLGGLLLFIVLCGGLIYLMFGFVPV
jgi:hypothetical protein